MNSKPARPRKERSPRCPSNSLADSIEWAEKIFTECGRSEVPAEVAATSMGYSSLSGASRTALASLSYYGLIQRQGNTQKISDLALRIIRPFSDTDKLEALRIASISPPIFADLWENHRNCSENVLSSVLLHKGFTEEGARKTAKAFRENVDFLGDQGDSGPVEDTAESSSAENAAVAPPSKQSPPAQITNPNPRDNVLATYKIPLGLSEAELVFTGEALEPDDFDALIDYVEIFKRQYQRKRKHQEKPSNENVSEEDCL